MCHHLNYLFLNLFYSLLCAKILYKLTKDYKYNNLNYVGDINDYILLDNELRRILPGKHEEGLYQSNSNDDVIIKLDIDFSNGIPLINVEEETIIERNGIDIKIITNLKFSIFI